MPLVLTIISALPQITVGVEHLMSWIREMRSAGQRTGEWTPAMETQFLDALLSRRYDAAYKEDSK